jgi:GT2 family glycosyltransferase
MEIIVVDNASGDDTPAIVKNKYPQVTLIENKSNLGAAKARNQGIEAAHGKWVLSLDCDVVINKDFLYNINNILDNLPPDVGLIQPKILDSGNGSIYSAGIAVSFLRRFHDIGRGKKDGGRFDKSAYVFGACSAAALYNRDMLNRIKEKTGYFDERFFFLFEDADLSWRARREGYKTLFYPNAKCSHCGNSSGTPAKTRQYLCLRNRYYILLKNDHWARYIASVFIYDLPRTFWLAMTNPRSLRAFREVFAGKKT